MTLLCALLVFVASASAVKNYAGYQVLRVVPQDVEQLQRVHDLYNLLEDTVDFWKEPTKVNGPVDIMVGPNIVKDVKMELSRRGLDFSIFVDDVRTNINNEKCTDCVITKAAFDYTVYHTSDEISQWVTDFANEQPLVTEVNIGNSYEGRPIKAVKISSGGSKRVIYIQGGIHAREWISPATMMYMANQLATTYSTDATVKTMVDNYDWFIVPSLNVDGYAYSWINDRMWMKNRQPNPYSNCVGTDLNKNYPYQWGALGKDRMWMKNRQPNPYSNCVGTDLNKNYPYQWGGTGASPNKCSETYRGAAALSGSEVSVVHDWIMRELFGNIALFIDFHNYGQLWLYPWGYTDNANTPQPDQDVQHSLAEVATNASQAKFGTSYFVGMSGPNMNPASGASEDYGYGTLGVKYTYVVELRDEGQYGFNIPETMIEDSGIETFEALKVFGTDPLN
ncbi:carboxypeptidase B-like [Amphiura filiformis]|uniref:carboxypeptidase B-like n=1 Tax=Amphiura filiformis TaxID=82378 RepID=UPI003B20F32A